MTVPSGSRRSILAGLLVVAAATIGGALVAEYVFGLVPCKLCLQQRQPYYVALPVAAAALALPDRLDGGRRAALALLALVFAVGTALAVYHAGAEWGFWPGPSDCGGGAATPTSVGGLLDSLARTRPVSCTEAAWRFAGLSLAGWNALISAALAGGAGWGASGRTSRNRQGSNSVSQ